jgi:hypothetical protein
LFFSFNCIFFIFPSKLCMRLSFFSCMLHTLPWPSHPPWFVYSHNIRWGVELSVCRSQRPRGLRHVASSSIESWGSGFESHSRHRCLCAFNFCLCFLRVGSGLATDWSPIRLRVDQETEISHLAKKKTVKKVEDYFRSRLLMCCDL